MKNKKKTIIEKFQKNITNFRSYAYPPWDCVNNVQEGGNHYIKYTYQPWDFIHDVGFNFFVANAIKYIARYQDKNGCEDIQKAIHYIEKAKSLNVAISPLAEGTEAITGGADSGHAIWRQKIFVAQLKPQCKTLIILICQPLHERLDIDEHYQQVISALCVFKRHLEEERVGELNEK